MRSWGGGGRGRRSREEAAYSRRAGLPAEKLRAILPPRDHSSLLHPQPAGLFPKGNAFHPPIWGAGEINSGRELCGSRGDEARALIFAAVCPGAPSEIHVVPHSFDFLSSRSRRLLCFLKPWRLAVGGGGSGDPRCVQGSGSLFSLGTLLCLAETAWAMMHLSRAYICHFQSDWRLADAIKKSGNKRLTE